METLCGFPSNITADGNASGSLPDTARIACFSDIILTTLNFCFLTLSAVIGGYTCARHGRRKNINSPFHMGHYLRSFAVLFMCVLHIMEAGEFVVALDYGPVPLNILLTSTTSLFTTVGVSIVHSNIEREGPPTWLMVEICLWTVSFICRLLRVVHLMALKLSWEHIRFTLTTTSCVGLTLLTGIDAVNLVKIWMKKELCGFHKKFFVKGESYTNITYIYDYVNAFSQMTFYWLNKLLWQGYKDPLEVEDLGCLPLDKSAPVCFKDFLIIYKAQMDKVKDSIVPVSLWKCYFKYIYRNYIIGGFFKLMGDCVGLVGPLGISVIIGYATIYKISINKEEHQQYPTLMQYFENGYIVGIVILLSALAQGTLSQGSTHLVNIEGIRLKSALQSLIYDKCLKLALWSSAATNSDYHDPNALTDGIKNTSVDGGSITNLISEDSYNVMRFIWIGHYVWAIPLKITIIMYLLYLKLGISSIIGAVLCIFVMTPLQFVVGKAMSKNSELSIERSDQRMMKINEVLQGIKILKMYAWECIYEKKISDTREKELELLNKDSVYWALITFLTHASSAMITLVTFTLYSFLEDQDMTPDSVFAGLALFNQLTVPLFIFPVIVPIIISAIVSTRRITEFLTLPELNKSNRDGIESEESHMKSVSVNTKTPISPLGNIQETEEEHYLDAASRRFSFDENMSDNLNSSFIVNITDAQFVWGHSDQSSKISIPGNIYIPKGDLVMIVGKIGSGKTSLLSALLGEMNLLHGNVTWSKDASLAYVPQKPWLLNTTIRDNIIFGKVSRTRHYKKVLAGCSLNTDILTMPNKDQTEVGESGSILSGGQKQRICLARAIYSNGSMLLLDDPLSALDQPVAQKVFEKGIKKLCILHKRTVVMVTHNLELLAMANQIIYVDDGIVRSVGTLNDVEEKEPVLANEWKKLLKPHYSDDNASNREKTAKDRWNLVKMVNKFSAHLKTKTDFDINKQSEHAYIPLRKRLSTYNGSRYLTHDLPLPTDECNDDIIRSSIPKRSSTKRYKTRSTSRPSYRKHKTAERSSSLQVVKRKIKPAPMLRQLSSPSINFNIETDMDWNTNTNNDSMKIVRKGSKLKRLFSKSLSRKKITTPTCESEHLPIKRLISTNSTVSDDYNDEDDIFSENTTPDKFTMEEEREYGKISKQIYFEYFKSCGIFVSTFYLILTISWQCMRVYTDICLSEWTNSKNVNNQDASQKNSITYYLYFYSILSIVSIILSLLSNALGQYAGVLARRKLHKKLLNNILKCPLLFFQSTPLGRIINRFSIDIGIIDKKIATSMQRLLQFLFLCSSAIIINATINVWFLFIAIPICILYYVIQKFYRCSARELQRLDAMTKSPIFSHFNETVCGVSSIRAYNQQERFANMLYEKLDMNTNAFIILNSSNCWLGIALDYLGGVIVFFAINASLLSIKMYPDTITPALVGLAINYTLLVPIYLNWVVKFLSDMEMYMSAVERVLQYSRLPTEEYKDNDTLLLTNWLKKGEVNFNDVTIKYADTKEPVLHKFNLSVAAGQKVAICGRTGSGKSSLLLSLLCMVDICDGTISIDYVDIKDIPLNVLRSNVAIVPQEVILFSGSIRDNLDPYGHHTDDKIWEILETTQLKNTITSYPGGLDGCIREGGIGWNAGARQLMGITQAILNDSPLLLMDEPTSALDPHTERILAKALLRLQEKRTVITVAHHLSTIIDYDRVIVIDSGRIVEDGPPKKLLANPTSLFSTMIKSTDE